MDMYFWKRQNVLYMMVYKLVYKYTVVHSLILSSLALLKLCITANLCNIIAVETSTFSFEVQAASKVRVDVPQYFTAL